MVTSQEFRLKSRPVGMPTAEHFDLHTVEVDPPAPGEVQVRNEWMSVDPSMRGRMYDAKSYVAPYEVGEAMLGRAVGRVTISDTPGLAVGDLVRSDYGWRETFNAPAALLERLEPGDLSPRDFLGIAGISGFTAWLGLICMASLKPGDVVFVSAASGAVGSVVCQIAKLCGNKVIGSAGGAEKVAYLRNELGVDEAFDYQAEPSIAKALARCAPEGIDVYFDNVGGAQLEAALGRANPFARFALCGMISIYNGTGAPGAPRNLMFAVTKNIRLQGFIATNYMDRYHEFLEQLRGWHAAGSLRQKDTVVEGLEAAPGAFLSLFEQGGAQKLGKMLVKLD